MATKTYDVLKTIGIRHDFSACLIIGGQTGGKTFKDEAGALGRMNIIIATPGRLCQHLSETAGFDLDNVMMFVLDEADRMLDMGFKAQIDKVVSYLPKVTILVFIMVLLIIFSETANIAVLGNSNH